MRLVNIVRLVGAAFFISLGTTGFYLRSTRQAEADPQIPTVRDASVHLTLGIPTDSDPSDDFIIRRPQYVLSYNPKRLVPNWAAWELNSSYLGHTFRHKGRFQPDDMLPSGWYRVKHDDYANSGYDRGHMVRSSDRTASEQDNLSTFFTTNIVPQTHVLNDGAWLRFEDYCQSLAKSGRELFILAGPIFPSKPAKIGNGIWVPSEIWKIVVVLEGGQGLRSVDLTTRVIAVKMPNEGIPHNSWVPYRTTVDQIESLTGYDFLNAVPVTVQSVLESRVDNGPSK